MKSSLVILAVSMIARAAAPVTTLANFPGSMVFAVQTDPAGNLYVAGFQGNYLTANPFVAKLSPVGQTLYSTTLAGSRFGLAYAIAVDSSGSAYVFGNTNSPDFPVTPGALQTTAQGAFQGFVTKLDAAGKIVYSTFLGGATDVTPGPTSAPRLNSILVNSAGEAIITGQAGSNSMTGPFPPAPALRVSGGESFVLKLDATGSKILAAIGGIGGMIAMDGQGNVYVAGLQYSGVPGPLSSTPGAFQAEPDNVCALLGAFFTCGYQYVAKLNPGLTQVQYATYVTGRYGATPAAISVDAQGDVLIAGTTNSPDYPATGDAYEPRYIASARPSLSCFFQINCVNLPPATGYLTAVNPTGTGLLYSTYFGGRQTDTIDFAAFAPTEIYLSGSVGSADLPGLEGYPQQCLPGTYETRLSPDGREVGPTRLARGKLLAYDRYAGTLIATSGSDVIAIDPQAVPPPIACLLDSADLSPVTAIAPGQLLSLFGAFSTGIPATPQPGQTATSLNGVSVAVNGMTSPLFYAGGGQVNFQAPVGIPVGAPVDLSFTSALSNLSESIQLPVVASNPAAFLNFNTPSPELADCTIRDSASVNGKPLLGINPDGSVNTCLNPAAAGSVVSLFLNGVGADQAPVISATAPLTVVSVTAVPGPVPSLWQVSLQIPPAQAPGGVQVSLTVDGVPVRDPNLIVWVK